MSREVIDILKDAHRHLCKHAREHAGEFKYRELPSLITEIGAKIAELQNGASEICNGIKGDVPGNDIINGKKLCDYCHADGSYKERHATIPRLSDKHLRQIAEEHSYKFVGILDEVVSYGQAVIMAARQEEFILVPHTLGGFRGGFIAVNKRPPTNQEIWDGGVRAGIDLAPNYPLKKE